MANDPDQSTRFAASLAVGDAVKAACADALQRYPKIAAAAGGLESPNPEDDDYVKLAIVGFSIHAPTEGWGVDEFDAFQELRASEFTDDVLEDEGADAKVYERFGCVCIGVVLGLKHNGTIQTEEQFALAHAISMAFMIEHAPKIYRLELQE
jgi:hypothetical protein